MTIKQRIVEDLKAAMKAGDAAKRDTLRMVDSMIKNVEIEKMKRDVGLGDDEVQVVIAKAIKQRKDAIVQYETGGRADLAEKEQTEVEILSHYMPEQLSEEAVRATVKLIISETGAVSKNDIGKVMGMAMVKLKGKADGQIVRKVAEEELQG